MKYLKYYFCILTLALIYYCGHTQTALMQTDSVGGIDLSKIMPLPQAYAHNDYWQTRPLWDALSKGFTAIEVDVHLLRNKLWICHKKPNLFNRKLRLSKHYLKPLWKLSQIHKGHIYPNFQKPILLIIDFKTAAVPTYNHLLKAIQPYKEMLTSVKGGTLYPKAITVLISGNRPVELLSKQEHRFLFLDGRITDKGSQFTNTLAPIISDDWNRFFGHIHGHKKIPKRDREILKLMVDLAHTQGKKIRLWNTPEHKNIWKQLLKIGVDYINTDELEALSLFLGEEKF